MKIKNRNEKELFNIKSINTEKTNGSLSLKDLYTHAHNELSLQQTKRDNIISLYVTICSFILPISFSIDKLADIRWFIFLFISVIGIIISCVINRYRVYKEIYWIACITISRLFDYKIEHINKNLVQTLFYDCLRMKGKSVTKYYKKERFHFFSFAYSLIYSAETLFYILETIVASVFLGFGLYLVLNPINFVMALSIGISLGVLLFLLLYINYAKNVLSVYIVLLDNSEKSFNKVFSKAWFLYIY